MIPPSQYVGITGFARAEDVAIAAPVVAELPPGCRLMAGVLVSAKVLAGQTPSSLRYPERTTAANLLCAELADAGAWPVVHFNTRDPAPLDEQLCELTRRIPRLAGIQLNVERPEPSALAWYRMQYPAVPLILQMNRASVGAEDPASFVAFAREFSSLCDHALFDLSQGEGKPLDVLLGAAVALVWREPRMRLALAGRLGPDAGEVFDRLVIALGPSGLRALSFDAETALRVSAPESEHRGPKGQDHLDPGKAAAWARLCSLRLFRSQYGDKPWRHELGGRGSP